MIPALIVSLPFLVFGPFGFLFGLVLALPLSILFDVLRVGIWVRLVGVGRFSRKVEPFELMTASLCLTAAISEATNTVLKTRIETSLESDDESVSSRFVGVAVDRRDSNARLLLKYRHFCAEAIVAMRHRIHHTAIVDVLRIRSERAVHFSVFRACFVLANVEGLGLHALRSLATYALGFGIAADEFARIVTAEFRLDASACSVLGISREAEMHEIENAYRTRADRSGLEDELAHVAYHKVMDQLIALDDVVRMYRSAFAGNREDA